MYNQLKTGVLFIVFIQYILCNPYINHKEKKKTCSGYKKKKRERKESKQNTEKEIR